MGKITEIDLANSFNIKTGLQLHLDSNFYPPLHPVHKQDIVSAFEDHWNGELDDLDQLAARCHLRDTSGLFSYFESFLNI
jgi:hypothetical protein